LIRSQTDRVVHSPEKHIHLITRLAVSTYSYWHFKADKYPVEKVIEQAAGLGFEGVEILHVQMNDETPAYLHGLRKAAFRNGLSLPMLSIHQDFVHPDPAEGDDRRQGPCTRRREFRHAQSPDNA
jgi:sugar phosphate isomerase/epimerase